MDPQQDKSWLAISLKAIGAIIRINSNGLNWTGSHIKRLKMIPRVGDSIIWGSQVEISPQSSIDVARAFLAWPT